MNKIKQNLSHKKIISEPWNFFEEEENLPLINQKNDLRDIEALFSNSKCTFIITNPEIEEVLWFIEDCPDICKSLSLSTMSSVEEIIFSLEQLINNQFKKPFSQNGSKSFMMDNYEKDKAKKSPLRLK